MSEVNRRRVRRAPLAAAIVVFFSAQPQAATIAVNDVTEGSVSGKCTLLDAVTALNTASPTNGCAAGNGVADTIDFSFFSMPTTIPFTISPADGVSALALTKPAKLSGRRDAAGNPLVTLARSTVSGTPAFRLISSTSDLTVDGLALSGGSAPDNGGAILVGGYTNVVVTGSVISGNYAKTSGGGIAVDCGNLTLTGSLVTGNTAQYNGGGLYAADDLNHNVNSHCAGTVTLTNSTVSTNTAVKGSGGGAYLFKGYLNASHAIVEGNAAAQGSGGGIWLYGNTTLAASTISGNSCKDFGGGIFTNNFVKAKASTFAYNTGGKGGAIASKYAGLVNSTVARNSAIAGGGIYATTTARYSTITGNHANDASSGVFLGRCHVGSSGSCTTYSRFYSSIVAGNFGIDITGYTSANANSVIVATSNHNVIDTVVAATLPADSLQCNPMLGALTNNGGATLTMLPGAGSCAIDAGLAAPPGTIPSDQRGEAFARLVGSRADIGAIEVQPAGGVRIFYDGFDGGP